MKAPPHTTSCDCQRGILCSHGKTPHQYVLRPFAGFGVVDFERGSQMTFGHETLHFLSRVTLFGGLETTSTNHSCAGVFPCSLTDQSSFRYL